MRTPQPGPDLNREIKAGFILQGTSLSAYCKKHGLRLTNVRDAILGSWDGPKGRALRAQVAKAAGVGNRQVA